MSSGGHLTRQAIVEAQCRQLRELFAAILPANPFYTAKCAAAGAPSTVASLDEFFRHFPFTTKAELATAQSAAPPYGTNLTFPLSAYTRCHQTSGTGGTPLRWLDTPESWQWMLGNWETIFRAAGVGHGDRIFFAFSFGPFIGFWLAFEAAVRLGCQCLPGGGLTSVARVRAILEHGATALCCTPTYAMHLAEVAAREQLDLSASQVKKLIVAGEPGGSIPNTRSALESMWPGARVFDHHGMTETGPVSYQCPVRPQLLHVMETGYIAEIVKPGGGEHVSAGEKGELILTTLGRWGSPLLRYRTGDLVQAGRAAVCECGSHELVLEGGILGRTDDMVVVRGVNVYPSAVEDILRAQEGVAEYQVQVERSNALAELSLKLEPLPDVADPAALAQRVQTALHNALNLRVPVQPVTPGTLPRFEMKARRWIISQKR